MFDQDLNCTCDVCACNCTELYYRDQSAKVVIQSQKEREEKTTPMKQTKLSAFINFEKDVYDMYQTNTAEVVDDKDHDDVITKTAIDLTQDSAMHNDVKCRLELQREVGVITPFVHGKNMSQLCKEKREKRKASVHEENCHLKPAAIEYDSSVVTPLMESPKNKRWYNNSLMDGDSVSSPPLRVHSPQISAILFQEDINLKRTGELKNKVIRRLIDNTSPTSELKKKTFNALVSNKPGVAEIISFACEMVGKDMTDTVDICKQMLMDNVI